MAALTSGSQDLLHNKKYSNTIARETDMDFFVDDCAFATVVAVDAPGEGSVNPPTGVPRSAPGVEQRKGDTLADCEVRLPLHRTSGSDQDGSYVIRVPAAVPAPGLLSPIDLPSVEDSLLRDKEAGEDEETVACGGAAWLGRCGRSRLHSELSEEMEEVDAAGSFSLGSAGAIQHGLMMRKKQLSPNPTERFCLRDTTKAGERGELVYCMQLPSNFVFGLRLPSVVEMSLVEYYRGDGLTLPPPPVWLSCFLYTRTLRFYVFGASLAFPATCRGLVEESTAVATLEGFCIVALNMVAQMGHLFQNQTKENDTTDETIVAQEVLLHDGGLFSTMQEERIQRWLQRYMPVETYKIEEERDKPLYRHSGCVLWPSAVAIAFHIALDFARTLFPLLLTKLESVILNALQPLLDTCALKSMVASSTSSSAFSLRFPQTRREAVVLLAQRPIAWWQWWEQGEKSDGGKNERNLSTVSTSRGYAALQVLQCFTLIYLSSSEDGSDCTTYEKGRVGVEEECEVAQFLLSAPTLFTKLLLDREIADVLGRATKNVNSFYHVHTGGDCAEEETPQPPRVSRALMRCFVVLLCWLAFRPEGYSRALAQKYFGSLLFAAALQHEQQEEQHVRLRMADGNKKFLSLLSTCSYDYFSVMFSLLCGLRDRCRTKRRGENSATNAHVNPWRMLRHGGILRNFFLNEDDRTTNTSLGHRSVDSHRSTAAAPESNIVPHWPLASSNVMSVDSDIFSSCSLDTLRCVIRELRSVLRLLYQDVFVGQDSSALTFVGKKRRRDVEDPVATTAERWSYGTQFVVSPHLAYHVYNCQGSSLWEEHMEFLSSSDEDTTDTSTSDR